MLQQLIVNLRLIKEMLEVKPDSNIEGKLDLWDVVFLLMERKSYELSIKSNSPVDEEFKNFVFSSTDKLLKNKIYKKIYDNLIFKEQEGELTLQNDGSPLLQFVLKMTDNALENKNSFRQKRQLELNSILLNVCISFESFVSQMVKYIYNSDSKNKNIKDKSITFNELENFENLESARIFLIDKELDSLFRDRFDVWNYTVFSLIGFDFKKIKKGIVESISEMYQCRNLIVHANGIVNEQYLKNVSNSDYKKGDMINLDEKYILNKLNDVKYLSWHMMNAFLVKIEKNLDKSFNEINDLIVKNIKEFEPAIPELLEFYSESKIKDYSKYIAKINFFLYYKIHGGLVDYSKKLADFSVEHLNESFKIAKSILTPDEDVISKFEEYIESLKPEDFFHQSDWPLFRAIEDKDKMLSILNKRLEKILKED